MTARTLEFFDKYERPQRRDVARRGDPLCCFKAPFFPVEFEDLGGRSRRASCARTSSSDRRHHDHDGQAQSSRSGLRLPPRARRPVDRVRDRHRALRVRRSGAQEARRRRGHPDLRRAVHARGVSGEGRLGPLDVARGRRARARRRRAAARAVPPRPESHRRAARRARGAGARRAARHGRRARGHGAVDARDAERAAPRHDAWRFVRCWTRDERARAAVRAAGRSRRDDRRARSSSTTCSRRSPTASRARSAPTARRCG